MFFLYSLFFLVFFGVALIYYFPKLFGDRESRRGAKERFGLLDTLPDHPIWIHAASYGEMLAVVILIGELRKRCPQIPVVVSTNTITGKNAAREKLPGVPCFFFPFDFFVTMKRSVDHVNPRLVLVMEAEIWPGLLRILSKRNIPCALINARMSPRSFGRMRKVRRVFAPILDGFDRIIAQSDVYRERYVELGYDNLRIAVSGNIKYDAQYREASAPPELCELIASSRPLFVAGSTHPGEEGVILDAFTAVRKEVPDVLLVLAPRHLTRSDEVAALIGRYPYRMTRRTDGDVGRKARGVDILLLDSMGELTGLIAASDAAFLGGSLIPGVGGHNVLEAAAQRKPVLFGPYMENFPDISQALVDAGGGFVVRDAPEIAKMTIRMFSDKKMREDAGLRAMEVVESNRGAAVRTLDAVLPLIGES
ncbi:MAG: 3-deoxy-D-manno-octulosonic acid transferase [Deltaproteobacteria bacterium]|nr:3-deoxy-D-manno-octulosonic acid transferase [Candidatus Zymogenaceae bacterium]